MWINDAACHGNFRNWAKVTFHIQDILEQHPETPWFSRDTVRMVLGFLDSSIRSRPPPLAALGDAAGGQAELCGDLGEGVGPARFEHIPAGARGPSSGADRCRRRSETVHTGAGSTRRPHQGYFPSGAFPFRRSF